MFEANKHESVIMALNITSVSFGLSLFRFAFRKFMVYSRLFLSLFGLFGLFSLFDLISLLKLIKFE